MKKTTKKTTTKKTNQLFVITAYTYQFGDIIAQAETPYVTNVQNKLIEFVTAFPDAHIEVITN